MTTRTIPELLARRADATPGAHAFMVQDAAGAWQPVTWSKYAEEVRKLAAGLRRAGVGERDRAAILAPTSLQWEYAQLASLAVGATVVGVDPHYPDAQLADVLESVSPTVLFVWDAASLARVGSTNGQGLKLLVLLKGDDAQLQSCRGVTLESLSEGRAADVTLATEQRLDLPAVTVFSSGTTGEPKPVVYTHRQIALAIDAILDAFPDVGEGSVLVCWLPLANLFQRIINFCAIARGATSYLVSDARTVMEVVSVARPHLLIGVPRFFERVHAGIQATLASSRFAGALGASAVEVARRVKSVERSGGRVGYSDRLAFAIADRFVLRRLRAAFGNNLQWLVSGSAPVPVWLLEWFDAIGLPILEAYGVSEDIVPIAMNRPAARRLGSVGKPLPPNEVTLADDGEILVRGPGVHLRWQVVEGAWTLRAAPDEVLATGDSGSLDDDGFLRVTGRKGDAFKNANGLWIAPAEVEGRLRRLPDVDHAVLIPAADGKLVAILNLDQKFPAQDLEILVREVAGALEGVPGYQHPSALVVATRPFSIEGGELTTNLKVRRKVVAGKFREAVETAARAAVDRNGNRRGADFAIVRA